MKSAETTSTFMDRGKDISTVLKLAHPALIIEPTDPQSTSHTTSLARLSQLLQTIEEVGQNIRMQLQQNIQNSNVSEGHAPRMAEDHSLPFHQDSVTANRAALLRISCERLARLVTPPRHLVFEASGSFYKSLALHIVLKYDIAKHISTGGDRMSAEELSKKCRLDADLLARLLRHLSQHGIYQEIELGVFSNTSASLTLVGNPDFKAYLDLIIHEGQLASPYFEQLLHERFTSNGESVPLSAFTLFSGGNPFYKWLHLPENSHRGTNFNLAMHGMSRTEGLEFLTMDYPFISFPEDTLLVDVGGGIGSLPELVLPMVPHLRFIVQDLEVTIKHANDVASPNMTKWISEGRVKFQVHDCFSAQPKEHEGAVFILKNMIHNYPHKKASAILSYIRQSNPVKLLIIDRLINPHLRIEAEDEKGELEIYENLRRPVNKAESNETIPVSSLGIPTMYDLIMGSLHGGRTRTLTEWEDLLAEARFRLEKVHPLRASMGQAVLEAVTV